MSYSASDGLEKATVSIEGEPLSEDSDRNQQADANWFAWLQATGAFLLVFNSWGLVFTYGVFQTQYQTKILLGTSASNISWIGSLQTFLLVFGTLIIGQMIDKGYLRPVLLVGTFLVTFGMMMTSICHSYWSIFLSQGLVVGLGFLCFFAPSLTIVPQYFERHRALALGFVTAGGPAGAIVFTIALRHLEPKIGFSWSVRVVAFLNLATLLLPAFTLRHRARSSKKASQTREAIDWRDVSFNLATCGAFFGFLGMYIPFFYIQLYSESQHTISDELNSYLVTILNVGSLVGRIIPPYLADSVGPMNSMCICSLGVVIMAFSWTAITASGQIIAFCLLFGFFSGAFMALTAAVVTALTPNLAHLGLRFGFLMLPASIGTLIGNPIAGALSKSGWLGLQLFCGAVLCVSWLCFSVARVWKTGVTVLEKI